MRNLFSSPLGANIAPIGFKKQAAWAAIIPAAATALGAVGSSVANLVSQADTNKTNRQIAEEQMQFAKEQYEREKEENRYLIQSQRNYDSQVAFYNSPAEERKRLEAAGINPALAKYGQSGLMQASQSGVGSPAQFKMPELYKASPLDFSGIGNSLSVAANAFNQGEMVDAQAESIRQKTRNDYVELMDKLSHSSIDKETKRMMQRDLSRHWTFENETWDARKEAISLANDSIRANTDRVKLENDSLRFANSIAPELHDMEKQRFAKEMAKVSAEIAELFARTDLSYEQKKLVANQVTEQYLINKNLPKSLHNDNAIKVATYKQIVANANKIRQEYETEKWRTFDVRLNSRIHSHDNPRPISDYIEQAIKDHGFKKK